MKIKFYIVLLLTITFATITNGQDLKSPSDFLGYDIGTQFSRHYQVLDYFNHISKSKKNNIILKNYGLSYERRPLFYAVISSENTKSPFEPTRIPSKCSRFTQLGTRFPNMVFMPFFS